MFHPGWPTIYGGFKSVVIEIASSSWLNSGVHAMTVYVIPAQAGIQSLIQLKRYQGPVETSRIVGYNGFGFKFKGRRNGWAGSPVWFIFKQYIFSNIFLTSIDRFKCVPLLPQAAIVILASLWPFLIRESFLFPIGSSTNSIILAFFDRKAKRFVIINPPYISHDWTKLMHRFTVRSFSISSAVDGFRQINITKGRLESHVLVSLYLYLRQLENFAEYSILKVKREICTIQTLRWIPAFAGMTVIAQQYRL